MKKKLLFVSITACLFSAGIFATTVFAIGERESNLTLDDIEALSSGEGSVGYLCVIAKV